MTDSKKERVMLDTIIREAVDYLNRNHDRHMTSDDPVVRKAVDQAVEKAEDEFFARKVRLDNHEGLFSSVVDVYNKNNDFAKVVR